MEYRYGNSRNERKPLIPLPGVRGFLLFGDTQIRK
jgi:hypothetical protein